MQFTIINTNLKENTYIKKDPNIKDIGYGRQIGENIIIVLSVKIFATWANVCLFILFIVNILILVYLL